MEMIGRPFKVNNAEDFDRMMDSHYEMFKLNLDESLNGAVQLDIKMPVFKQAFLTNYTQILDLVVGDEVVGYVMYSYYDHVFYRSMIMTVNAVYVKPEYRTGRTLFKIVSILKQAIPSDKHVDLISFSITNTVYNGDKHYRCDKAYTFKVR